MDPFISAERPTDRVPTLADGCGVEMSRLWDTPPKYYQVLGERSSGTNFLNALIASNTTLVPSTLFGWKHGFPAARMIPRDMVVFVSFRHPIPWLRSMHRKPWHAADELKALAFSDFIRAPWITLVDEDILRDDAGDLYAFEGFWWFVSTYLWNQRAKRGAFGRLLNRLGVGFLPQSKAVGDLFLGTVLQGDRDPTTGVPFANILRLRSAKVRGFLGLRQRGCNLVLVNYEYASAQPEHFLTLIADQFGIVRRPRFRSVVRRVGRYDGDAGKRPVAAVTIESDDLAFIWNELDQAVEAELGYTDEN